MGSRKVSWRLRAAIALAGLALAGCAGSMRTAMQASGMTATLEDACARSVCRMEVKALRLRTPDGGTTAVMTERYPYADGGKVALFPGETFTVDFKDSKSVGNPHFVALIANLPETRGLSFSGPGMRPAMTFRFTQEEDGPGMRLVTQSTLDAAVKFDATAYYPTAEGLRSMPTTTCPIIAGGSAFESWPFPMSMIVLSNFRTLPATTQNFTCQ